MPGIKVKDNEPFEFAMKRFKELIRGTSSEAASRAGKKLEKDIDDAEEAVVCRITTLISNLSKPPRSSVGG